MCSHPWYIEHDIFPGMYVVCIENYVLAIPHSDLFKKFSWQIFLTDEFQEQISNNVFTYYAYYLVFKIKDEINFNTCE